MVRKRFLFFAACIAAGGCNARSKKRREGEPQLVQVRLRRLQACNARSKKRREGEPQLVQVRLRRLQACNARSKKRREGEEVGT